MINEKLEPLSEYFFDRDVFVSVFNQVFTIEELDDLISMCECDTNLDSFKLYKDCYETYYIIHLVSGTIISWYKHLGRCNTCNNEPFSYKDLYDFCKLLLIDYRNKVGD